MNKRRGSDETKEELDIQLHLLQKAVSEFDIGDLHEVRNIARALRLLLTSDDHGDASLLARAGHGDLPLPDTRMLSHPQSIAPVMSLTGIIFGAKTIGIRAFLEDAGSNGNFSLDVWLEQIFADDKDNNFFSRHRLIKAVANQGGGTHFPTKIKNYYEKLEKLSVTGGNENGTIQVDYRDVEKHSIRQIAFEILSAFGKTDGRGVRAEAGAQMIRNVEFFCYPGRYTVAAQRMKPKKALAPLENAPPHEVTRLNFPNVKLPYDNTHPNSPCPCKSGLKFMRCCSEGREFDADFIEKFKKKHLLEKYDPDDYQKIVDANPLYQKET